MSDRPAADFRNAILAAGLTPPEVIEADGKLHRFASNGKRSDDAGWYVLHADGIPAGEFGCWRTGIAETWRADPERRLSREEEAAHRVRIEALRRTRDAEAARSHAEAAKRAAEIWQAAQAAPDDHAYLLRKGVKAHGLRLHEGALVVPLRDGRALHSLQFIAGNGEKRFLAGARVCGGYYPIGKPNGALCLAEGYATAASIHEATGYAVAVAFNAGNLLLVARSLRAKFPDLRLVVCADDDAETPGNPGLTKAREAAQAVGGLLAVPDFGKDRPAKASDFNDLHLHAGPDAVREGIEAAQAPAEPVPADVEPVRLIRGDEVALEPVRWLWPWYLPRGMLAIIGGAPGAGKSTIALTLAATVTSGGRWPDGTHCEPGDVLIWSGEDSPSVSRARLQAAGADLKRVYFVTTLASGEPFDPARDMRALEAAATALRGPRLLILDPVVLAVLGDSHKNSEVRRSLQPVVDLSARLGCATLGVTHFTKGTAGRDPVERVTGSLAFAAMARLVLVAARSRHEPGSTDEPRRMLLRAKSNVGPDDGGFEYTLDRVALAPDVEGQRVLWGARVDGTARDLLHEAEAEPNPDDDEAADIDGFLRGLLADGPVSAKSVQADSNGAGYSWDKVKRASRRIGVDKRKEGMKGGWVWMLDPRREHEGSEECTQKVLHPSLPSALPSAPAAADDDDAEEF